jgi:hypothetical protein
MTILWLIFWFLNSCPVTFGWLAGFLFCYVCDQYEKE